MREVSGKYLFPDFEAFISEFIKKQKGVVFLV